MTQTAVTAEWWQPYMPDGEESFSDYRKRIAERDEVEFVLMEQQPDDLAVIAYAQRLLGTRHTFSAGKYCVMAIRDLIFCAYTLEWSQV